MVWVKCIRLANPHVESIFCMLCALLAAKLKLAEKVGLVWNVRKQEERESAARAYCWHRSL